MENPPVNANYILDAVSGGHLVEWKQITNNPVPTFDYSNGVGTGFDVIVFPRNSISLVIATVEIDVDPATGAVTTVAWQNAAGSPVARTSVFDNLLTPTSTDVTELKGEVTLPFVFDSTLDNTGLSLVVTLGTGATAPVGQLSIVSFYL
jgi:hypothetical protein